MHGFTQGIIQRQKRTIVLEMTFNSKFERRRLWLTFVVEIFLNLLQWHSHTLSN